MGAIRRGVLLIALGLLFVGEAAGQSAVPPFTGKRVTVAGTEAGPFPALEGFLEQTSKAGGRAWYLAVVGRTGSGADAHHDYEDDLWTSWLRDDAARQVSLDPDRTLVILLSIGDRQVSVRPGVALQRDYGFRGTLIDQEIVRPYFVPYAKAGDYPGAIRNLVNQTEAWFARADQKRAEARRVQEEAGRRAAGQAAAKVTELRATIDRLGNLEKRRTAEGLATGNAGMTIGNFRATLAGAEKLLATHPEGAHASATRALEEAGRVEIALNNLGKLHDQAREATSLAAREVRDLRATLERARLEGGPVGDLERALGPIEAHLAEARENLRFDYAGAVAAAERVQRGVAEERERLAALEATAAIEAERRFHTHTVLPGVALLLVVLASGAWIAVLRRRHGRRRDDVAGRLSRLNERIVGVMQTLDGLKERQKMYLLAEGGDAARLAGRTASEFDRVRRELEGTWTVWVGQNDLSTNAKRLIAAESALGTAKLDEADRLVRQAAEKDDAKVQSGLDAIAAALDVLEKARGSVQERLADAERTRQTAEADVEKIVAAGFPATPYLDDLERIESARAAVLTRQEHDPLGAADDAAACAKLTHELGDLTHHVLGAVDGLARLRTGIDETAAAAAAARGEGFLLSEENGNPDPLLGLARVEVEETRQFLAVGDPAGAREQLGQGMDFVGRAAHVIGAQRMAREFVVRETPLRRQETRRLAEILPGADIAHQTLARDHRADAWGRVARAAADARAWVGGFDARVAEAERAAAVKTQHYFRAANLIEAVRADQERAERAVQSVHARLAELLAFREETLRVQAELLARGRALQAFVVEQGGRVQGEAQARAQRVAQELAGAMALSAQAPPNWESARNAMMLCGAALEEAFRAAQSDVDAFHRLHAEIGRARTRRDEVQRFLDAHVEDRQAAALKLFSAGTELRLLEEAARQGATPWAALLGRAHEVVSLCDRSQEMAQADIRLVERLQGEFAQVEVALAHARAFHRHGVRVETGGADSLLDDARRCLSAGEYERALKLADEAEHHVKRARESAEDQARAIERAIEERRREERRREDEARRRREAARSSLSVSSGLSSSSRSWSSSSPTRSSGSSFSSFGTKSRSSGSSFSSW